MSEGVGAALADVIKDLKGAWANRISNPIVGAFALSWLAVNYRALVVLFAENSFRDKFTYLDNVLYPCYVQLGLKWFVYPLALALLYIYALPAPTEKVYRWTLNSQRKLNKIAREVAGEKLLSVDEMRALLEKLKVEQERMAAEAAETERLRIQYLRDAGIKDAERANEYAQLESVHRSSLEAANEEVRRASNRAADLAWKLIYERAISIGFASSESVDDRITDFLTARPFAVLSVSGGSFGQISFLRNGAVAGSDKGLLDVWARWKIRSGRKLDVFDNSDRQIASFTWDPGSRQWRGMSDGSALTMKTDAPGD
ncbi:TPA: hypothetical protein QDZ42_000602 [Stenotrophomonas maltophilia]|nr:hypothetical protein [Stenotrophomonas maltophilia]HDS1041988.1 hypothetical protein [Stenotrophomonas maltophilia]